MRTNHSKVDEKVCGNVETTDECDENNESADELPSGAYNKRINGAETEPVSDSSLEWDDNSDTINFIAGAPGLENSLEIQINDIINESQLSTETMLVEGAPAAHSPVSDVTTTRE